MLCLGIETTAHTFGASVIKFNKKLDDVKIMSNVRKAFTTEEGGMIPFEVAEHHVTNCEKIIQEALDQADVGIKKMDLIAFSQSPGIGHMLRVGTVCARSLSRIHNIPIMGVNHCIAHLEIGRLLSPAKDPILLYASGANTQVIAYDAGKYRVFGETLDIGIGNFLDQFARAARLGFPGGPKVGMLAQEYRDECKKNKVEPELIELPYSVKGMDVSFGGLLTKLKGMLKTHELPQLCYALEETVYAMMCEVTERALAHCQKTEVVLGGGVACAPRLQKMCETMCKERGASSYVLANEYNIDNAAMITWLGILMYYKGDCRQDLSETRIEPYLRTDEVEVTWR